MHKNDINFDHLHWNRKLTCAWNYIFSFIIRQSQRSLQLCCLEWKRTKKITTNLKWFFFVSLAETIKEITNKRTNSFNQTNDVRFYYVQTTGSTFIYYYFFSSSSSFSGALYIIHCRVILFLFVFFFVCVLNWR